MCRRTASLFLTFVILTSFFIILQATAAETPEVLVQGAPIHGANGIMFDGNDRLHIASVVGREIVVMDPETGEILDRLGTDQGVEGPDDLTFGPDGSLYWTSLLTGEVGRLSPDGVKTGQMVIPGVNPITFSDDGRLFVALDFLGDGLYELDPDLVEPPRLIIETLGFLNAFDFGPDGFLYGPIWTMGQVVRIDVDTAEVTLVADDIGIPAAVKFDSQGRLHVLDHLRGEVLRVDTETGGKEVIAQLPPGGDNLAFDSQDRLFVSHAGDGSIFQVLPDGTTRTVSPGGMIVSGGVAVLARPEGDESVFVADLFTLREFDGLTGEERSIEHSLLTVPGSITSTFTVSPDGGNLVLSSWFANEVQVWNPETHEPLEAYADFAVPLNAIRFQGDLVVAELGQEAGAARVVRASAADPAERATLIDSTGGLFVPAGLAATDDDLWVGDWAAGMVLQLVADGELLAEPVPVATNLAFPEGITVAPDGNLLVVETGAGRLSRINLANGEVSTVAEGLAVGFPGISGYPPTWVFSGVAVGPSGTIYITSDINDQLLAIPPPSETEANKELVRRYIEEVWNQQNVELVGEFVSPDVAGYLPEGEFTGIEGVVQHVTGSLAAFPDFNITIEEMIAEGDKVAARVTTRGTHEGALLGLIPPTGKQVVLTGIFVSQIADGKIVGDWSIADMLGVMQQIGVIPSDREDYTWGEPSEVTGAPGDPEANKAIVRRNIEEVWHQGNLDVADETVDPNFVYHLVGGPEVRSSEAFKQYVATTRAAFPDIEFTIEDMIAEGDKVALRWTVRGTHKGEFMGIPPTDKQVTIDGISLERFADGKLVEGWTSSDYLSMMQQLGVIPPMEPPVVEEGPLAGIHTSIASGVVTDPGETEQVMKDGVMHIITDGVEYEIEVESTWDNGETTTSTMKVRGCMDLIPISETEAVGKGYSTTEQYSPDGELMWVGSAESDDTVNLVTGESSSTYYIYASGLGEYAGYSHITIGEIRVWIDEDGTQRVEATGDCIVSKIEHDFTIASASQASLEKEPPLTGLHTSEISGTTVNPGEIEQTTISGVPHIIQRGVVDEMQIETVWDTGELGISSGKLEVSVDLIPISSTQARGKSYFTGPVYSESGDLEWFTSGEGDMTADLITGKNWSVNYLIGVGNGSYAGYTHISIISYHSWVDEDGVTRSEGTSRCLVMKVTQDMSKAYFVEVQPGLNMISVPLNSLVPHTARSLAEKLSATVVIEYNEAEGRFVGFTPDAPDNGFDILGGKGYIVNVAEGGLVGFTGTGWSNQPPAMAAPPVSSDAWAFVVSGSVFDGDMMSASDGEYTVTVKNLRTGAVATETVGKSGYFAAAYADLSRKAVVEAGDKVEIAVIDSSGKVVSGPFVHDVTLDSIRDAVVKVRLQLGHIIPEKSALLQNYPNPFNPETWIPFHLNDEASVSIRIFSLSGQLIKTLELGHIDAGVYVSRTKAAYWDGKNEAGEEVASGIYFYSISAGDFSATKKMAIRK